MSQIFLHSSKSISCGKIVSQFIKGEKYIKSKNTYLIPYHCSYINQEKQVILGNFIYPMWNTLERNILVQGTQFKYSYVKGIDFMLEFNSTTQKNYKILSQNNLQFYSVQISDILLKPNSILLFSIDKKVGDTLIENKLM